MIDKLGEYLRQNSDPLAKEMMADWDAVGSREPWHRVPPSMDHDHLPEMIQALAETALTTFFGDKERKTLAWIAVQHGEHRFELGIAEETLHREYELLRWALWRRLKEQAEATIASEAIIRLDSALSFSHGASLRGYHRGAIEASDDWPAALERYLADWTFPSGIGRDRR